MTLELNNRHHEIENSSNYRGIDLFNELWRKKEIVRPLLIMVGGYAGTGKSTLIEGLRARIDYLNPYATGFARAAAQCFISKERNPALYESTFKLHSILRGAFSEDEIWSLFLQQRTPVENILCNCASFIASEHQHTAIDGNHISPNLLQRVASSGAEVHPVYLCLKVSDPAKHMEMMQGPTHSRQLSGMDCVTARVIHDRMIAEASHAGFEVFEYNQALEKSLKYIDDMLLRDVLKIQ